MVWVKLSLTIIIQKLNKQIIYIEASLGIYIFCNLLVPRYSSEKEKN